MCDIEDPSYLISFIKKENTRTFVSYKDNVVNGFCSVSKVMTNDVNIKVNEYKIGPLYADDENIANSLLDKAFENINDKKQDCNVYIDCFADNKNSLKIIEKYDFKEFFKCARVYTGKPPNINFQQIFGLKSLAFYWI